LDEKLVLIHEALSISVLMTTYNDGKFLENSIGSVLRQTYPNFEFVIIDDGSMDGTEKTLSKVYDKRIRYLKMDHLGRSKALNYGLRICKYDWVALIDADDIWHPNKLEKQVMLIRSDRDVIFTHTLFFREKTIEFPLKCPQSKSDLMKLLPLHGHMTNSSIIYNRKYVKELGSYNESLTNSEDYDLLIRMIPNSTYKYADDYLVFYRLRSKSLSSYSVQETKRNIRSIQIKYFSKKGNGVLGKTYVDEEEYLDSWREYFYGNKKNARKIWLSNKKLLFKDYKIILAFIITYLPDSLYEISLESRLKLRIKYYLKKFIRDEKLLNSEKVFKSIVKDNL